MKRIVKSKLNMLFNASIVVFVFAFTVIPVQDTELKKKADSNFSDGNYLLALPMYAQLLSLEPKDAELNYKYGACLIYSDEDTDEPIKYLNFAVKNQASTEALYFLGKAYHLNYQFKNAIEVYSSFLEKADGKLKGKHPETQSQIQQCAYGSSLLSNIKEISVLEKIQTSQVEFFRSYNLEGVGGRILVTPDELLSSNDRKKKHRSLIYFPGEGAEIYFSSYGKEDQLDIYKSRVMGGGDFSKPEKLTGDINTDQDENFPFMHPDGETLYFSSKGHNSMGGYDIYKCQVNGGGFTEGTENLDFAINSPDDDVFYIADTDKKLAYFASSRSSKQGDIHVYKVLVETFPLNIAIIKGSFNSEVGVTKFDASINVLDAQTNKDVGTFYTQVEDGEYVVVLPNAGRYKFFVEAPGSSITHTGMVEIPGSSDVKAYKQTMDLVEVNGKEKLIIKNLFEEDVDGDVMALIQKVLKERAQLEVNSTEEEAEILVENFNEIFEQAGFKAGSTKESVKAELSAKEQDLYSMSENENDLSGESFTMADDRKSDSENDLVKAEGSFSKMKAAIDQKDKEKFLIQAAKYKSSSLENANKAIVAMEIGEFFKDESKRSKEMADKFGVNNLAIGSFLAVEDESALDILMAQKDVLNKYVENSPADKLAKEAAIKRKESEKLVNKATDLSDEFDGLNKRISSKKKVLEKVKKEKDKAQVQMELDALEEELQLIEKDKNRTFEELAAIQKTASILEGGRGMVDGLSLGNIDVEGNVRANSEELDQEIADIIVRNENIEISEVEIQEILIRRPDLIETSFSSDEELAEFRNTYHLPDYITAADASDSFSDQVSLDENADTESIKETIAVDEQISDNTAKDVFETKTEFSDESASNSEQENVESDIGSGQVTMTDLDENTVDTMMASDLNMISDPDEFTIVIDSQFMEVGEVKEFIYPGYEDELNAIETTSNSNADKAASRKQLNEALLEELSHTRNDLNNSFDKGEIDEEVFKKNSAFINNLELAENFQRSQNIRIINDSEISSVVFPEGIEEKVVR